MMRCAKINLTKLGIILFFVFAFFIGLFSKYFSSPVLTAYFVFAFLCIVIGNRTIQRKQSKMSLISIICVLIVVFNRNERFVHGYVRMDMCIIIGFLTYYFICNKDKWHQLYSKSLVYLGIFYGVTTILLSIFPSVYIKFVEPLFDSHKTSIGLVERGFVVGFSSHYSTTAIYLAVTISIPVIIFLRKELIKKEYQKWAFLLTIMLYISILLTGKRAHSIFILFSGVITYYFLNREKTLKRMFYILFGACAMLVVFYIAGQFFPSLFNVISRFEASMDRGDILSGRGILLQECIKMFRINPVFGTGWGSYTYYTSSSFMNAHNVYIQLLAENGILLSIPFFFFIFGNYLHVLKTSMKASIFILHRNYKELCLLGSALFLQTFFIFYCFTGNPLYDFQMLFPYILSCAIGEYFYRTIIVY